MDERVIVWRFLVPKFQAYWPFVSIRVRQFWKLSNFFQKALFCIVLEACHIGLTLVIF